MDNRWPKTLPQAFSLCELKYSHINETLFIFFLDQSCFDIVIQRRKKEDKAVNNSKDVDATTTQSPTSK